MFFKGRQTFFAHPMTELGQIQNDLKVSFVLRKLIELPFSIFELVLVFLRSLAISYTVHAS